MNVRKYDFPKSKLKDRTIFSGRLSSKFTNRVPRKKFKDPYLIFKSKISKNIIDNIYKKFKIDNSGINNNLPLTLRNIRVKVRNQFGIDVSKTKGESLHFFLPKTGMDIIGWFYKGFLESALPKSRVSFIITPKSSLLSSLGIINESSKFNVIDPQFKKVLFNLETHLKKSVNKFDKHFVIIDSYYSGRTKFIINEALKNIYGEPQKLLQVSSMESTFETYPEFTKSVKNKEGTLAIPESELFKYNLKSKMNLNKKDLLKYSKLKKIEKIQKYTYYYLGFQYFNNPVIKKIFYG